MNEWGCSGPSDIQTGFLYASLLFQTLRLSSFPGLMCLYSSIHPFMMLPVPTSVCDSSVTRFRTPTCRGSTALGRFISPDPPKFREINGRLTSIPIRDPARISVLPSGNLNFLGPEFARFPLGRSENLTGSRIGIQHVSLTLELKMSAVPLLFTLGFILETWGWGRQRP